MDGLSCRTMVLRVWSAFVMISYSEGDCGCGPRRICMYEYSVKRAKFFDNKVMY